ncbi:VOC family protein [Neobacillus sp. PS3-34]|uniref:VOC family protein n=1 Tax=Neobacillus sp. PS3-34 TaxID=3070678 RepID=UPI0027E09244|nr:VOC family protein [Neobacillus sp. PS3-34]WML47914.1 VOC family protein [Neobacillus sp. PS3-34]
MDELKLDHIVNFVKSDPSEIIDYWRNFNLKGIRGGSHGDWGTYNSLIYFGLSYIEFLSVQCNKTAKRSDNPLIKHLVENLRKYEGLGQICFRTTDIHSLKKNIEMKGYTASEIYKGERIRSDGLTIRWKMLFVFSPTGLPYPFFIEWEQSDHDRREEFKKQGVWTDEQEKASINAIHYVVHDFLRTAEDWANLLNVQVNLPKTENLNQPGQAAIMVGRTEIIFCNANENATLKNIYKRKGERPFLISFNPPLTEPITFMRDTYV